MVRIDRIFNALVRNPDRRFTPVGGARSGQDLATRPDGFHFHETRLIVNNWVRRVI